MGRVVVVIISRVIDTIDTFTFKGWRRLYERIIRIVSWNVNSVRARLSRLLAFLRRHDPDIVCLQETKVANDEFPLMGIESAGYHTILHGQQNYNGVAILIHDPTRWSNLRAFSADATQRQDTETPPFGEPWGIRRGFPDDPVSEETRVVSACVGGLRFVNVYVVNGAPRSSDSFAIKRRWMARLGDWLHSLPPEPPLIVVGDFNVAPDIGTYGIPRDCRTVFTVLMKNAGGCRICKGSGCVISCGRARRRRMYTRGGPTKTALLNVMKASALTSRWVMKSSFKPFRGVG